MPFFSRTPHTIIRFCISDKKRLAASDQFILGHQPGFSGKVTFQGSPVPVGMISFEPMEPGIGGGFAPIKNGEV